jgi:hypothetical protein
MVRRPYIRPVVKSEYYFGKSEMCCTVLNTRTLLLWVRILLEIWVYGVHVSPCCRVLLCVGRDLAMGRFLAQKSCQISKDSEFKNKLRIGTDQRT